jgi:tetratricopeptide (TPR) repeat protein
MIESYAGQYHDAILSLNTAIKIDPYNKEAYFERAVAYYEQGDINQALSDYLASDVKSSDFSDESFSMEYASGLYEGLKRGMHEEINNGSLISIPLSTLAFWTVLKGVEISPWYVKATLGCVGAVGTGLLANEITTELKEIVTTWDQLEQKERGDLLGYIIGKHGIEIFTAYGSAKCMKAYQNLRKANNALNFESSLLDKVGAQSIKTRLKGIEKYQKDRDYIQKTFGRHTYPEHEIRDHLQKMGYDIAKRPAGIPDNYLTRFTKKECGISYIHPKGAMVEEIRIMPGNINSPNPAQQQKYVTHLRNGEAKTVNGENINRKSKDAHIPVDEYIYIPLK